MWQYFLRQSLNCLEWWLCIGTLSFSGWIQFNTEFPTSFSHNVWPQFYWLTQGIGSFRCQCFSIFKEFKKYECMPLENVTMNCPLWWGKDRRFQLPVENGFWTLICVSFAHLSKSRVPTEQNFLTVIHQSCRTRFFRMEMACALGFTTGIIIRC